jgi:hypothetical protein
MTDKFTITGDKIAELIVYAKDYDAEKISKLLQSLPMVSAEPVAYMLEYQQYCDLILADELPDHLGMMNARDGKTTPLYTSPQAITKLPEPIFTKVADGIELGHNLWGGIAIRLGGEFTYVQVNYNHEYTDNATRARLADNIVKLIQGEVPNPQALADLEPYRKDAERYQWLRRTAVELSLNHQVISQFVTNQGELDAAIAGGQS